MAAEHVVREVEELKQKLGLYEQQQAEWKAGLTNAINTEIVKVTGDLRDLYKKTEAAVINLENRVTGLERFYAGNWGKDKKSTLHAKDMKPKELSKDDEWRRWRSDVEDYAEEVFPGMQER